jgi:hypothetical protein
MAYEPLTPAPPTHGPAESKSLSVRLSGAECPKGPDTAFGVTDDWALGESQIGFAQRTVSYTIIVKVP